MEGQIHTTITLKPLRFAFLVPVGNRKAILDAIETSTLLWGGVWNPIIPIYRRSPSWTSRPTRSRPTAQQWLKGHLEFFEPDVVVLADGIEAPEGYGRGDVVSLSELHESALKGEPRYGLSIQHLWQDLFQTRYRFVEHGNPLPFVIPAAITSSSLHSAVVFGRLPAKHNEHIDASYFSSLFRAESSQLDSLGLESRLLNHAVSPISLTGAKVPHWFGGETVLFAYDHRKSTDILALWNLRAHANVIAAIPIDWMPNLQQLLKHIIESLYRQPDERGMGGFRPHIVVAPGVDTTDVQNVVGALQLDVGPDRIWYYNYPEFWDTQNTSFRFIGSLRREVSSRFETLQIDAEGNAWIPLLRPDFVDENALSFNESWANHVSFSSRRGGDDSTIIFPEDASDIGNLVGHISLDGVRRVRSGISYKCRSFATNTHLEVPSGTKLITWWLRQRGWDATESGAGRLAAQLLRVAGGPRGVPNYCSRSIINAITTLQSSERNGIASKAQLLEWLESDDPMDSAFGNSAERRLERLIDRGILRVGLRVQCSVCGQHGWHQLSSLAQTLSCQSCLASFPFPQNCPPQDEWRYRAYGPYSLPDKARGSFSVALAVGFFYNLSNLECAYALGLDIQRYRDKARKEHEHLEVDATVVVQRSGWESAGQVVFCECKTMSTFDKRDFDRAHQLAQAFPKAILAFVTLKKELGVREKMRFIKLLKALPDIYTTNHQAHRPLLILTATELYHRLSLRQAWINAGDRAADFAQSDPTYDWTGDLLELCTVTQHLYLSSAAATEHYSSSVHDLIDRAG